MLTDIDVNIFFSLNIFSLKSFDFKVISFVDDSLFRWDSWEISHIWEGELREIKLNINFIEINYNFCLRRSINLDFSTIINYSGRKRDLLSFRTLITFSILWFIEKIINLFKQFSPGEDRIIRIFCREFSCDLIIIIWAIKHIEEAVNIVILKFMHISCRSA